MKETSIFTLRSEKIYKKVISYFEEKNIFLDEYISLEILSKLVGTNTTYLSNTINRQSGCNLHTFINAYKIHYAEKLLISNADELLAEDKNNLKDIYKKWFCITKCILCCFSQYYRSISVGIPHTI